MGACCGRSVPSGDAYGPSVRFEVVPSRRSESRDTNVVDPATINHLILELLELIASFIDNEEESPMSVVKLHLIADKEDGWFQVVSSMVNVIPLDNPLGPSAITIVFDDCPLPSRASVMRFARFYGLSAMRALADDLNVQTERNVCVVLGCIADKLAGPSSIAVLSDDTLDYMLSFMKARQEPRIVLFALIALEKFAQTTENKLTIKDRLDKEQENPLVVLELYVSSEDFLWRQVGFCAKWTLDNIFPIEGRPLSYEVVDTTNINAVLNTHDVSEYLKISCDGLEARSDSYSFESVRCTFEVNEGAWYYECKIITSGVMQIGWATKSSNFLNHEGYGIGDDLYSLAYDGCRRLLWHEARPSPVTELEPWQAGDIVGCLIDMDVREAIFSLNGQRLRPCSELFETTRNGFFAAASFMAFQQCRFNFGLEPFKFPPTDRKFSCFNDFGSLTDEEKKVIPRRMLMEKLRNSTVKEGSCTICCDAQACCILEPCQHRGFCSVCTSQLKECPMCRGEILSVRMET